jgi:hypothetical protein
MRGPRTQVAVVVLAAALALAPAHTQASTGYPAEITSQLHLSYMPGCSICHASGDTDAGTVTTQFGALMVSDGLFGGNDLASLHQALAALVEEKSVYITALQDDVDSSDAGSSGNPGITYGCFNVTGQGRAPGALGTLLVGLVLLCLLGPRVRSRLSWRETPRKP